MKNFDEIDYFSEVEITENPYPYFEYLRSQGPVVRLPKYNVVAVTGYDEGVAVLRDHKTFSSINSAMGPLPPLPFEPEGDDITEQLERHRSSMPFGSMLVAQDQPQHTRIRSLLVGLLTPQRLKENEGYINETIEKLIDGFADRGEFEVFSEFAYPLATLAISDLLGVPEEDREKFLPLFGKLPGQLGGDDQMENNPMMQLGMFFYQYIAERRANPQGDVLTTLAQAKYRDGELPDIEEVTTHAATMYGAGQDTTVRLIVAMLKTLAEKPDLRDQLQNDRSLIPAFVEEVLRLDGPTKAHFRLALRRTKVGDIEVEPGTTIMMLQSAMRRDPRKFDSPDEFRLDRRVPQLAFGSGIHVCVGAPLARTEARLAMQHILDRLGEIRIDERVHGPEGERHFEYEPNYTQRALCAVHLTFNKI